MKSSSVDATKEQLSEDFNAVMADVEALLKATANQSGEKLAKVRDKAEESLRVMKARMVESQAALLVKTQAAGKTVDDYIHENPWKGVSVAAGIALVIGLLVGRR